MISQELTAALEAQRLELNARFRAVATLHSHLNREQVMRFVEGCLDPLVVSVHRHDPQAVPTVLLAGYDAGLQLVAARATELDTQRDLIHLAWRDTLASMPAFVAARPITVLASVNNALLQLCAVDASAAGTWLRELNRVSGACETVDELLMCGQVHAWKSGLAHLRTGALAVLDSLRDPLVRALFAVEVSANELRAGLKANRWFDPQHTSDRLNVVRRVGAFRGFGGAFIEPPIAAAHADGWVIRSGTEYWYLIADAFGHSFHRGTEQEWQHAEQSTTHVRFVGTRLVDAKLDFADAGPITSAAAWSGAIACTTALSHQVIIVAAR